MINNASSYNLTTIRDLLEAAFNDKTLRRLCQDRPRFQGILTRFSASDSLSDLVDKVIEYCGEFLLWDEFLAEVKKANPRQYQRFEVHLHVSKPAVKEETLQESIPAIPPPLPDTDTPAFPPPAPKGQDIPANPWEQLRDLWETTLKRYWLLAVLLALITLVFATAQVYNALTGEPFLDLFRKPIPIALTTPTGSPTPTNTPIPSPTALPETPTPPLCPNVQISSCLELVLAPGAGQVKKCPTANGIILLAPAEIEGLVNLQGRAILTDTNGCTCDWQGRIGAGGSWQSINSPLGDCRFSIGLPVPVTIIHLQLTVGQQRKDFIVKVEQ
jgi:hypothetical protein